MIVLAGTPWELLRAALTRVPRWFARPLGRQLAAASLWTTWRRDGALADAASHHASDVDAVVALVGTGLPVFRVAPSRVLRCLDYPIANWDVARELLSDEARLNPEFAGTIGHIALPTRLNTLMHQEIEAADVILVGSEFARQTFITAGVEPKRLVIATYGVDTELFAPDPDPKPFGEGFTAAFVGQIGQRKGISYLLEAWAEFSRSSVGQTARLILVGGYVGDPTPVLLRSGLFEHSPPQPRTELPMIYRTASVLVLPSIVEGMPLVVLEAMACGVPCIVTTNGAADVVREGIDGFVIPIRDSAAIADRLQRLADDPELRHQMSRNARARALEYTWATYADRVLDGLRAKFDSPDSHGS